ncbi:hypothetical protein GCM10012319_28190 [Comamonas sp. KCTC 72670]|nr:hypothetical protein GCM10012319_28190 [Comamonas sp. KCTC 72670]
MEELGPNHYRLVYSPGLVHGLAAGDEIGLSDTAPSGFIVKKRGGNFCIWFFFPKEGMNRGEDARRLSQEVSRIGGRMEGGGETTLVFSAPASSGFDAIADFFDAAVASVHDSAWMFSNAYAPGTGARLDWWQV